MKRKSTPFNISHSTLDIPHSSPDSQDIISNFENNLFSVLKTYPRGTGFLAAVSGGADSMAMLASLYSLSKQPDFCFKIAAAHVEHGIRPAEESLADADFVSDFCKANGIERHIKHIPQGKAAAYARRKGCGIEAAARFFRHRALFKTAAALGENTVILFAHTKDDLLETALMRILRGSGPSGLAGMRITNEELRINIKRICRPILAMSRNDVISYLKAKEIVWREDSTNTDEKFLRNRIRRRLAPLLNEFFPAWKKGIASLAETQSLAADFIVSEASSRIEWKKMNNEELSVSFSTPYFLITNEINFFNQPQIIREEAVFTGINKLFSSKNNIPKKTLKRSVIRRFCAGEITSADLGSVKLSRGNEEVCVTRAGEEFFEQGISRLISCRNVDL